MTKDKKEQMMTTPILKVMTEYCEQYVDDEILSGLKTSSAPLYFQKMWGLFNAAIPYFNKPTEMQDYLVGTIENPQIIEPQYDSCTYTVSEDKTDTFTVDLGEEYRGYELCACRIKTVTKTQKVIYTPLTVTYNHLAGTVTIPVTQQEKIPAGTVLDFDFYTDGYFKHELSRQQMMILGFCFELVWNIRFEENWLDRKPKIEDKSFSLQNIANKQNADTARVNELRKRLAGELRQYEQNCYYSQLIGTGLSRLV